MEENKYTDISEIGEFGLIERLIAPFDKQNPRTIQGPGDDAAVLGFSGEEYVLISSDLILEGVDFDLVYFPLKHLGYKVVVRGINDIFAMNGFPTQITVSLGISSKLKVEHIEELYEGIRTACLEYDVDLAGGDTTASVNGLAIAITAVGHVAKENISYRNGAKPNDLICITGDLGAAYMGLHLMEREKRALERHPDPRPMFEGFEHILRKYLKPTARLETVRELAENNIIPTSMIDLSDGLASDLLQVCRASGCGARVYLDRIPIARETYKMAEELNADPVVAAINGGDDQELLFTVPLELQDKISRLSGIDVIGHITEAGTGAMLVTPDGSDIPLSAPGIGFKG